MRRDPERLRFHYWTVWAFVERWVLLLVWRGPRTFWGVLMHHPVIRPLHYGFSRIAQGSPRTYDVSVVLTPPGASSSPTR